MSTVIVDYASGNLHSALKSFQRMAAEAAFKAVAQALRGAVEPDPRMADSVPSTKGTLTG